MHMCTNSWLQVFRSKENIRNYIATSNLIEENMKTYGGVLL